MIELLRANPDVLILLTALLGLIVGSFLNVVIFRMPLILEARWQADARETLLIEQPPGAATVISLAHPPSRCLGCGAGIRPWQNVPIVSWLLLRGRCSSCKTAISVQYPVVEGICALASAICAAHFGFSVQLAGALIFTWTLLALAVIDLNTQLLPDDLCLPLLWLGLLLSLGTGFTTADDSIIGAAAGYLVLWSVFHLFRLLTGKEGMGYGDFKLLAALGAWMGWTALPMIILLSSLVGAVTGLSLILLRRQERSQPIPYGPFLSAAGWISLLWGERLRDLYLHAAGLHVS